MRRSLRSSMLFLISLVVALAGAALPTSSAQAVVGGSISGTVWATGGAPIADVEVTLYAWDDGWEDWDSVAQTHTDGAGAYELPGVDAGTYRLGYDDLTGEHVEEYWSNWGTLEDADDVVVEPGVSRTGMNIMLERAGHVTGRVTGPDAQPLADVAVEAYKWSFPTWRSAGYAVTAADGTYDIGGLSTGPYRLAFTDTGDRYLSEYWDDASSLETAADVNVSGGETTSGKDAELAVAGAVAGTVTGAGGPLADVEVSAFTYDAENEYWDYAGWTTTDESGDYRIGGLPTGTYRVGFHDYSGGHVREYWDDAATLSEATPISVTAGSTVADRDAVLALGGRVSGVVTAPGGAPIEDVAVTAFEWDDTEGWWEDVAYAMTRADGSYDLTGLPTGEYRVGFYDYSDESYAPEYWDDSVTLEGATPIAVTAGTSVAGKDAELARAAVITGTVTGSHPVDWVWVSAYEEVAGSWEYAGGTYVRDDGTYRITRLPAGTYRIGFEDDDGQMAPEFWDDVATVEQGTDVTVAEAATVTGKDAALSSDTTRTFTNSSVPTIAGTPQVGQVLTASPGSWTPTGATYSYQWLADGVAVPGATGGSLGLTAAQQGRAITVRVTATGAGRTPGTAVSAATVPVAAAPVTTAPPTPTPALANVAKPKIKGKAEVGRTLKATTGTWTVSSGVTFGYQWLANGKKVKKATKARLKVTAGLKGKKLQVKVTARVPGASPVTVKSTRTTKVRR